MAEEELSLKSFEFQSEGTELVLGSILGDICNVPSSLTYESEDLLHKNTKSYQCFAQVELSNSSIFRDPLYFFPELEDPHLKGALWDPDPEIIFDVTGCEKYSTICQQQNIIPFNRVLRNLPTPILDLQYYRLKASAIRSICDTLETNPCVETLSLQGNQLEAESLEYINKLLNINETLTVLDLRHCHIGVTNAHLLLSGLLATKILDLDLTYNDLADEGLTVIAPAIQFNRSIQKLNLSHNNMGQKALEVLKTIMEENYSITDLDLSWNFLYDTEGLNTFMEGLMENVALRRLNLSWNAIGESESTKGLGQYLKSEGLHLEFLDLSNNRITGPCLKPIRLGIKDNSSLKTIKLGNNPMTPEEAQSLFGAILGKRTVPTSIELIDLENVWVRVRFLKTMKRLETEGIKAIVGGIYSNYELLGPNIEKMLLNRAKFVGMMPKSKKKKKNLGHFILTFQQDYIKKELFAPLVKAFKIKLDDELVGMMVAKFQLDKKHVSLARMKRVYLEMYPDTKPPEKGKKKKKGGRKKKKK